MAHPQSAASDLTPPPLLKALAHAMDHAKGAISHDETLSAEDRAAGFALLNLLDGVPREGRLRAALLTADSQPDNPTGTLALLFRARREGVRLLETGERSSSTTVLLFSLLRAFQDALSVGVLELRRRVARACEALRGAGRPPVHVSNEEIDAWLDTTPVLHAEYTKARRARPDADILAACARLSRGRSRRSDDVAWLRAQMPSWCVGAPPFALTPRGYRALLKTLDLLPQPLTLRKLQVGVLEYVGVSESTFWRRIRTQNDLPARRARAHRHDAALALAVRGDQAVIDLLSQALARGARGERAEIETL